MIKFCAVEACIDQLKDSCGDTRFCFINPRDWNKLTQFRKNKNFIKRLYDRRPR